MSKRDEQIARMKGLMTYGIISESKKTPVTESFEGPDGKVYAIIREGSKYYIKYTNKGNEIVKESFDYIGGFMNKKNNEFLSYNQASKNLELKIRSLNEAYGVNKSVEMLNPDKKENLMIEMTDAMKASIARYRQIINEASNISMNNTGVPEAPKTTSFNPNLGEPFTNKATAELDKDLKATAKDPEKQGEPFGEKEKTEEYKNAEYVPQGSVANQHPSGGKVVRVNENEDFEETIEECEEWGSCGLPNTEGVGEVGDDAPFTETTSTQLDESDYFHNSELADDEQLEDTPDEINLDENDIVGFASDDENFNEGEEDIDLDDIDLDLEDDTEEDIDLDDIDTEDEENFEDGEEFEDDSEIEYELETDDEEIDELEMLRNEVEELRKQIEELKGETSDEDYEDEDFNDEDEDYEYDELEESCKFLKEDVNPEMENIIKQRIIKRQSDVGDIRRAYGIPARLKYLSEYCGSANEDSTIIAKIKNLMRELIVAEVHLRTYKEFNYTDDDMWSSFIATIEEKINMMNRAINKLSFNRDLETKQQLIQDYKNGELKINPNTDRSITSLEEKHLKDLIDYYDENINPDVKPVNNDFEDEDIEIDDIDIDNIGFEDDEDYEINPEDFDPTDMFEESKKSRRLNEEGTKLNVFGKHPGYRKKPMTLPQTGNDKEGNYEDWNDNSVYSEEPFGNKIGSSAPYDKLISDSVKAVMESLKKKH